MRQGSAFGKSHQSSSSLLPGADARKFIKEN